MDTSAKADEAQNSSLPRNGDNKFKLFEKIVYFASGSIGDEALLALKNSNAESTCLLSDSVTHCIVGKNYVEADVSAARELYDVTTVTPEWIRMSVLCNKLLPTKPFNPFEDNLFSGLIICVSQQTVNDCKILWALVTYNGGTFQLTLNLKKATHLVVTKPFGKKYDAVISNGSDKIKIVTPDWIIDCLKNKELCPETNYHPRLLVMPKLLPSNQSFKLQTSGLSTITGFADFDAPVEQSGAVIPKNQGLEQLKQRLPWNQPPTPPTSQPVHTQSSQVAQGTTQSNTTQLKPMMSLMSTPQLQRLSQQQVQQLQLQQQTHANNQLLSQQQIHMPQQQNQFQQIRTQQMQHSKQIQLQHGQQLQYQSNQQQMQQTHMQLQQQGQQTHLQIMQKGQQQTLQQNQQHIQMQQKVQQLQSIPSQQLQNQQQQVVLQQQNVQIQSGQQQQQQQNVQQLQSNQQPNQIPLLQQQTVQIQHSQVPQLQPQSVQIQQGQPQQQQVQIPQLQQQTVQLQQGQQQGQLPQLQKQTVQLQQNPQHSNQLQQGQQIQQIQPQQIQFQTSNGQQVQFPQQVTQNTQVHLQQQQQQPQIQNVQSTQPSQICIVSNGQQLQQAQSNPPNQQQQLLLQQQQRLMFQQRIVQQGGGTVSTQWRMAHPPSNMPRVQVNQQQSQQIQQQQTLVIGQQPTVNMNNANTQPTTQTQWPPQQTLTIQRTIQQPMDQRQVIWSQQSPHGPQQMIHMDAKTHQQIQAMNPAERLAFINKLTKQRNLVLQQFNARQQQAAGVAGGTNIVRPSSTPNGQTTVIRTLNHQLISSTGMTPAQQAQWNQIRQQQLLAQQQQQQQQQMAGGTVTTGLQTSAKTVSNTLVNNQQVAQPQTTVWQQSPVTEQGHQQTSGSMSAVQLAQIHQRQQQLQQLRLQQLQMDASQKQQTMQQQVVPSQAQIAGAMQPNVVPSPQVATAQTSVVQPQQTPTLPTNEPTETQTPSQEPFTQTSQSNQQALVVNPKTKTALANMLSIRLQNGISSSTSTQQQQISGQEISAAGQLRLMTAQHHAAQQQGTTQGTYQSRTVLNNVTNNSATNRAAQVVGRAAVQTAVTNKTLPTNYNQSAAVRVAAVLAKSAAGQTVGHQQLPHQARFFGHNPNLKLPPDKCLLGCIFLIVEYDRSPDTIKEVPTWKQIILDHGGEIEPSYTLRLTHILCQTQKHPLVQQGLRDGKRCITAYWLSDIITKQQLMPPWYALHFPTPYSEERPCRQMLISLTNFENDERNRVKFMIELTGARVTSYFSADNNILVTRKLEGKKVKKARDINRPVVNVQWLNEILFGHLSCMYQPENVKYQQFNLNNPFRVDYNLVLHLMGAWKIPINVTQESYDRIRNNPVSAKRKRSRPNANFPDQENNDLSTADIIITNINPPPIEYRPCVMLSGFGLGKEEQRMVLQLGGTIAKNYSDATHLVMKESVRTTKFLCCVSTVKHIVNGEWLKDSSTQHMFLGEAIYTIEEVSVDQKVICKVHKILSNPNRHELFKGKIFYVTPGVTHPSVFVVRQIIESAGGTVEKQRRSLRAIQELEPNTYIVIASNNDLHLVADLIRSSYGIYSSEFVLSAVMTQYVNYDMAYKKTKKITN